MIYNYTKSCNKHNQLILWSLLRLYTKILKEACGDPPDSRKKKHVVKDRRILIVSSCHDNILIILSFYFIRNPTFLAAENRDFGRFVTTR